MNMIEFERRESVQRFLVMIVGIIFLGLGVFLYFKNDRLVKNCTEETLATVVDMKQEFSTDADSASTYIYYPILEYQVNDDTIRVTMDKGSSTPAYNINDKITILYNPNNTKEFLVKGDSSSNIFTIILVVLGVFVTGYGVKIAIKKES